MSTERVLAGRYVLRRRIGTGGAGVVWRAHDRVLDRVVAVKLLHPDLARDAATASRFRAEATSAAKLTHPHAVVVYDIGREHNRDYLVMELVDGATLSTVFAAGKLPPQVVALLGAQVARALGAAHARGLVHRDVKPANVLVTADGVAKVADFGIARALGEATSRLTSPGHVMGTARYLAPEQLRDEEIDGRADVYALGLLLHQALTGEQPFGEGTAVELASRRLVSTLEPVSDHRADVPPALDAAVARAIQIDPDERFADGIEFAAALSRSVTVDAQRTLARIVRQLPEQDVADAAEIADSAELEVDGLPQLADDALEVNPFDAAEDAVDADKDAVDADDDVVGSDAAGVVQGPDVTAVLAAEPAASTAATARSSEAEATGPRRRMDNPTAAVRRKPRTANATSPAANDHASPASADRTLGGGAAGSTAGPTGRAETGSGDSGTAGERSPEEDRKRRATIIVGVLALLAVAAVAVGVLPGMFGSDDADDADLPAQTIPGEDDEPTDEGAAEPEPLAISAGGDHDPFGDGEEHPADVPLAFDGDPSTSWQTQQYQGSPELGGLKPGVGIWFDLGEEREVHEMVLAAPGADATIYAADSPPQANEGPEDFATEVATVTGAGESEDIVFDEPVEAQVFLVWLTSLPPDGEVFRASVSEVSFIGH